MQLFGGTPAAKPPGDADLVKEGSVKSFNQDVVQASMRLPVLVDFGSPRAAASKQLSPVLEKLVRAAKGKVRLVRINIDENRVLAEQLRIQTVPTVYAFVGGQPVTGFAGPQPESQIRLLIERLLGEPAAADAVAMLEEAKAAAERGDVQAASQLYDAILAEDPGNAEAIGGLVRCLIAAREFTEARSILDGVPKELQSHAAVGGARAALTLAEEAGDLGDPRALATRVERDEDDHEARYKLATVLFLRGQPDAAIEHLMRIVRRDRAWKDDQARKQLLKFFDALGPANPATARGRRALSTLLFR